MSGAGAKRGAGDGGGGGPPEKKPPREEQPPTTLIEPLRLGGISSTEEMDLKVLQFKNKKLAERLEQRQACEDELRERIEKLEKRQATDDATLLLVNRFWGQLDAEVQALLRRYEGEGGAPPAPPGDPPEPRPEGPEPPPAPPGEAEGPDRREPWGGPSAPLPPPPPGGRLGGPAAAFVAALSRSGPEEGELRLRPRLAFAPAAVARLVEGLAGAHRRAQELGARLAARPELAEAGRALLRELLREHRRLQDLTLQLQEKHHRVSLELAELQDKATSAETKVLEMGTTVEGLQWDSAKLRKREGRLNRHLAEALEQLTSGSYGSGSSGGFQGGQITLSMQKFEMLNAELEGNQELANSRMAELEKLQQELQQAVRGHERLKVALRSLPEEAVKETLEYKVLQSQFSLLYHESLQVKTQLDEARALLLATKNSHLRHIEHMESDELGVQKRLRTEVIQLEDTLAQVRKEYEMLRIEFEQNLAANEQAGPINREMRHLISSLQNHNHQLKGDVQRYKRKLREVQAEINKEGAGEPEGDEAAAGHVQVGAQGAAGQGAADGGREEEQGRGGGAARAGAGAGGAGAAGEQEAGGRGGAAAAAARRGADRAPPAQAGRHQAGGGGAAVGDGRDGPGLRGHAGAEPAAAAAAAGEGRRQLQADVREDQGQSDPQAAAGGEGRVGRAGPRPQGPGGRPAAGGAEAGGERTRPAEQLGGGGEGAGPALPGPGTQQEEGGGGGAAGGGPAGAGGARPGAATGAAGLRRREQGRQGQGVPQPQEGPGGAVAAAAEAGEAAEGGGLRRRRPDPPGGDQGVSGPPDLPVLQRPQEGRRPHQVLPRLLLRVRQEPLRHAAAQVPQVQRRLRRPRLPPRLHQLSPAAPGGTRGCSVVNRGCSFSNRGPWRWVSATLEDHGFICVCVS